MFIYRGAGRNQFRDSISNNIFLKKELNAIINKTPNKVHEIPNLEFFQLSM